MKLKEKYIKDVIPEIKKEFNLKNSLEVPRLKKVTINSGLSRRETEHNSEYPELVAETITKITGQKPAIKGARKSIAGFKIREGLPVGVSVTLRKKRMYDFVEKLINIVLPRIRDFRGLDEKNIDQSGNLSIGIKEHSIFPEIDQEKVNKIHGLQVVLTTANSNQEKSLKFFKLLGFPFKKD